MAASSSSTTVATDKFNELVVEGRKLAGYFFLDANTLDNEVYGNSKPIGTSCQIEQSSWSQCNGYKKWYDSIQTGRANTTFQTVSKALGSLSVGCIDPGGNKYRQLRTIDTKVIPNGPNIPIDMTHQVRSHWCLIVTSSKFANFLCRMISVGTKPSSTLLTG
jgi:hypothetical protein